MYNAVMDQQAIEEIADHLNEMSNHTEDMVLAVASDIKASLAERIAAILNGIAVSHHPLNTAAVDLICSISVGEREEPYPLTTGIGKTIVAAARLPDQELQAIATSRAKGSTLAANIVLAAISGDSWGNESADHILRRATGRNLHWWLGWIRQNRI